MAQIVIVKVVRPKPHPILMSASDHDECILSYPNVSARIRSCQISHHDCDNPALDRDHHIRTYVILSGLATLS